MDRKYWQSELVYTVIEISRIRKEKIDVIQMHTLVNLKAPRIESQQLAEKSDLSLGYFVTPSATTYLTSPQKRFWQRMQDEIIECSAEGAQPIRTRLSKYYSASNSKIMKAQKTRHWLKGETKGFYKSYLKCKEDFGSLFEEGDDDDHEDDGAGSSSHDEEVDYDDCQEDEDKEQQMLPTIALHPNLPNATLDTILQPNTSPPEPVLALQPQMLPTVTTFNNVLQPNTNPPKPVLALEYQAS